MEAASISQKSLIGGSNMSDEIKKGLQGKLISPKAAVAAFEQGIQGRQYVSKNRDERAASYASRKLERQEFLKARVPFITYDFLPDFYLVQGLSVIGAVSGKSKSTTASNILAGFIQETDYAEALVISNEEKTDFVYDRVACILTGYSFMDLVKGKLSSEAEQAVRAQSLELTKRIEVVDGSNWNTAYLEDTISILEHAERAKVNLVIIDYLQTITSSRKEPLMESFMVSKKFGTFLMEYGKRAVVPVVVFAQLSDGDTRSFKERIENDKMFFNHAFTAIEIIPDFETLLTTFKVHKDRLGLSTGKEVVMGFKAGKYVLGQEGF